jgi:hypothetical protein
MAHRFAGLVGQEILLRHVSDVLAVGVFGVEVVEGLVLDRARFLGDRAPPFFGVRELRVDVINDTAERVKAVPDPSWTPNFRK